MGDDNDGPVGVRDYPPGCIPLSQKGHKSRVGATRVEEGVSESPLVSLASDFLSLDERAQMLERRRVFELLRQHFQRKKDNGESIPRPDLTALKYMNKHGLSSNFRGVGSVPGVEVGDTFEFRAEMFAVGLHPLVQAGICYITQDGRPIATSIVASGGYEDDRDFGEVLHYSGQGGNDYRGEKRQVVDQKLSAGNEAMMNSYRLQKPVRVIRGHDVYSYDGLYNVFEAKAEPGASGHKVYQFKLRRLPGQPEFKLITVKFKG